MHGRVGDEERSFTVGLEAKRHVSRVVAGRGKRRDSRSELHVTRDGLEAVEERLDAATNVRAVCLRPREREGVGVHGVPRSGKEDVALEVRVPAQVIDVQVREEDEVDAVAGDAELREGDGKQPLVLRGQSQRPGGPTPVSTRIVVPAERMRKELHGSRQVSPAKSSGYSAR